MTTREEFLARIRNALDQRFGSDSGEPTASPTPRPEIDPALVRTVDPMADNRAGLVDRFEAAATEVGMVVHRCEPTHLAEALQGVLRELSITTAAVGVADEDHRAAVERALAAVGGESIDWRGDRTMDAQYDVHAGITDVVAAIAEAGSLVVASEAHRGRGLSLVPPVHIALVPASRILADLSDFMAGQPNVAGPADDPDAAGSLPAAQCLITGPSKTADIEGILVTGVHGPGAVHILLIDA